MGAVRNVAGYGKDLIGGITGSTAARAAERGAEAQQAATMAGIAEQRAAREQIAKQLAPYMGLGESVLGRLGGIAGQQIDYSGLPSVLPTDIGSDTLFNALKQQAISGIESSAAARGKLFSGTTPQAIAQQVQNLALSRASDIQAQNMAARQQLLGERVGQQERQYQQLFNLGQMGQSAAAMQGSNIQTSASNLANLLGQGANAYAAGQMGVAQAKGRMAELAAQAGGAAIGSMMSDIRVKEDIKVVGKTDSGFPVYTFRYIGDPTYHMGVMAQDIEKEIPDAVTEINGIKHVNYGAL